jgi:uncharacterized membrane protein YdfJ with MMPL/SSD domain
MIAAAAVMTRAVRARPSVTAVLVDATIVRMVLVPAVMQLRGDRNWWMPRWLDRLVPRTELEAPAPRPAIQGA